MDIAGEWALHLGVVILAMVALPLLARSFLDVVGGESEPIRAIGSAAIVLGCLGMCGIVWAPALGGQGWIVYLIALIFLKFGLGLLVIFTWCVFRLGVPAAALGVFVLLGILTVSLVLDLHTARTDASYPEDSLGFRAGQLVTSLPFLWLGLESWRAHRLRRKGLALSVRAGFRESRLAAWAAACFAFSTECLLAFAHSFVADDTWRGLLIAGRGVVYGFSALFVYHAFYVSAGLTSPEARAARQPPTGPETKLV